jgi:hypothetical protein
MGEVIGGARPPGRPTRDDATADDIQIGHRMDIEWSDAGPFIVKEVIVDPVNETTGEVFDCVEIRGTKLSDGLECGIALDHGESLFVEPDGTLLVRARDSHG